MDQQPYDVLRFGHEREPIIVIDGFSGTLDRLRSAGRSASYETVTGYPGIRAQIDARSYAGNAKKSSLLAKALRTEFGFHQRLRFESSAFSIVTLQPEDLTEQQRNPHFDEAHAHVVALVHYLDGESDGGTAFYRHKRTGFETITPERLDQYKQAQALDDDALGPSPARYHRGDSARYEWIGEVAAKPDRLIAYRGRQLHSGNINIVPQTDPAISSGRLTITAFIIGS